MDYLDANSIEYFLKEQDYRRYLVVQGIKLVFDERSDSNHSVNNRPERYGKIVVAVSPLNFQKSFELYLKLMALLEEKEVFYIQIHLNDAVAFTTAEEDITALLSDVPDWCSCVKNYVGLYECPSLNLKFRIIDLNSNSFREPPKYVLHIAYELEKISAKNISTLVSKLYELNLIQNKHL